MRKDDQIRKAKLKRRRTNLGKSKKCSRIEDHKKIRNSLKISNEWWS